MPSSVVFTNPALFGTSNYVHLRDSAQALDNYYHLLRWKQGECVMDFGSGCGNVTTQNLAIRLPNDYKQLMPSSIVFTNPALFGTSNYIHLRDSAQALDNYYHLLRWKQGERVMDFGSGCGNVTTQNLATRLPNDYKQLIGVDISRQMVKYATKNNNDPRITFIHGDITEPDFQTLQGFFKKENINIGFDKIFSFHCLYWIKNSKQWSKNIYSLLKPGGQTFLMSGMYTCYTDILNELAFSEKWLPYTKVTEPYRGEFHYSTDIDKELIEVMTRAGFVVECCEHYTCHYELPGSNAFELFKAGDFYAHMIPENLHSEYFDDMYKAFKKYEGIFGENQLPYTTSIIVAAKPECDNNQTKENAFN